MKDRIIILTFLGLLMLVMSNLVSAFVMPLPVYGKVNLNGVPSAGFGVIVTNLETGDTITTETNKAGEFQVELANLPSQYREGDRIFIKACTGDPMCEKIIIAEGGSIKLDFNIVNLSVGIIFKGIAIKAGDLVKALGYWWFAGFIGLVTYWLKRKKNRGQKMLVSFFKRLKEGKYKR